MSPSHPRQGTAEARREWQRPGGEYDGGSRSPSRRRDTAATGMNGYLEPRGHYGSSTSP